MRRRALQEHGCSPVNGARAARSPSRSLSWPVFPVLQAQSPGIILVRPSTRAKVGQFGQFPSFPVGSGPLEVPQLASFSSLAVAGSVDSWPSCLHKPNAAQSASSEVFQSGCLFCPAPSCPVFQFSSRNSAGLIDAISVNEGLRSSNYGSDADTSPRGLSQLRPALWHQPRAARRVGVTATRSRARW